MTVDFRRADFSLFGELLSKISWDAATETEGP